MFVFTFRLFDSHRFGHTWSSRSCIVDSQHADVVICSLCQASHSVGQVLTAELCAAGPVLLPSHNLGPEDSEFSHTGLDF